MFITVPSFKSKADNTEVTMEVCAITPIAKVKDESNKMQVLNVLRTLKILLRMEVSLMFIESLLMTSS